MILPFNRGHFRTLEECKLISSADRPRLDRGYNLYFSGVTMHSGGVILS